MRLVIQSVINALNNLLNLKRLKMYKLLYIVTYFKSVLLTWRASMHMCLAGHLEYGMINCYLLGIYVHYKPAIGRACIVLLTLQMSIQYENKLNKNNYLVSYLRIIAGLKTLVNDSC